MKDTVQTGNRLIAEFMGGVFHTEDHATHSFHTPPQHMPIDLTGKHFFVEGELRYHQSYDWIMPVIYTAKGAIEKAGWGTPTEKEAWSRLQSVLNEVCNVNIKNAHFCLVKFIEWYNATIKEEKGE